MFFMDILRKIFLVLFVFCIFFVNSAKSEEYCLPNTDCQIIKSINNLENDILNSKDNEPSFSALNNSSEISSRRNANSKAFSFGTCEFNYLNINNNLVFNNLKNTYLINNSELALRFLLNQIHPNAP